jgi:hypothetical protein
MEWDVWTLALVSIEQSCWKFSQLPRRSHSDEHDLAGFQRREQGAAFDRAFSAYGKIFAGVNKGIIPKRKEEVSFFRLVLKILPASHGL